MTRPIYTAEEKLEYKMRKAQEKIQKARDKKAGEEYWCDKCEVKLSEGLYGNPIYTSCAECVEREKADTIQRRKEKSKQKYQENKEAIREKLKQYKTPERWKIYIDKHREEIRAKEAEKVECGCGSTHRRGDTSKHKKTKKHLKWEELQNL